MKMLPRLATLRKKTAPGAQGDGTLQEPVPAGTDLKEMSFLDHLEDLRWSLIKGLSGVLVAVVVCSFFSEWIIDVLLLGPARADFFMYRHLGLEAEDLVLQNRTITGQFFAHIGSVVAASLVLGSPIFVYFLWKFVEPGLYPQERRGLRFASFFATLFFIAGIAFGYCIVSPMALQFFANYQISEQILNEFDITKYFGMVTWWSFAAGLLFELPVVIYFLASLGIVTPEYLRQSRRYALIAILVIAAFLTPPDPISQSLMAIPMLLLYEGSIALSAFVIRRRQRELDKALR